MADLTWRTYKSPGADVVPVAEIEAQGKYSFEPLGRGVEHEIPVGQFDRAWRPVAGEFLTPGDTLPASLLAEEPVVLWPEGEVQKPVVGGPYNARPDSQYWKPQLVGGEAALVSPEIQSANSGMRYVEASPIGRGVYQVPPGYRLVADVIVDGGKDLDRVSYNPRHGLMYVQSGGKPVSNSRVEVFLDRDDSMRKDLSELPAGTHPISPSGIVRGEVSVSTGRRIKDVRRLPTPSEEMQWHAVDYGQTDGSPISPGSMWVIETDADPGEVREAVRRTLPAGSIYRIEPPISQQ